MALFNLTSLAPTVMFTVGQRQLGRRWLAEIPTILALSGLGAGMMVNTARAAWQALGGRPGVFERTPKFGVRHRREDWRRLRYQLGIDRIVVVEAALAAAQRHELHDRDRPGLDRDRGLHRDLHGRPLVGRRAHDRPDASRRPSPSGVPGSRRRRCRSAARRDEAPHRDAAPLEQGAQVVDLLARRAGRRRSRRTAGHAGELERRLDERPFAA